MNLLNDAKDETHVFMNKLFLNEFYPRMDRPTRVTERSATLIDDIFTNVYDADMTSGVWIADITDHLPIYKTLPPATNAFLVQEIIIDSLLKSFILLKRWKILKIKL